MAQKNCSACDDLRKDAPNFIANGLGTTEITSLKNNTGLNPKNSNDDCKDLNNMADCLIGNMTSEVDSYDNCHWHEFAKEYINNAWTMFKGIIAAICGLWTRVEKQDCVLEKLMEGIAFKVGEDSTDGSYVVAGKGVSFLGTGTAVGESQVAFTYVAGGLVRIQGSLLLDKDNFTDSASCYNFDNGSVIRKSSSRLGNPLLNNTTGTTEVMVGGGELLYEIRILKSQYPMIRSIFSGIGGPTGGGAYQVNLVSFSEGEFAYGQHGSCNEETGEPSASGNDRGHIVEPGYFYVQARMVNVAYLNADGRRYSPRGFMGIRLKQDALGC